MKYYFVILIVVSTVIFFAGKELKDRADNYNSRIDTILEKASRG